MPVDQVLYRSWITVVVLRGDNNKRLCSFKLLVEALHFRTAARPHTQSLDRRRQAMRQFNIRKVQLVSVEPMVETSLLVEPLCYYGTKALFTYTGGDHKKVER